MPLIRLFFEELKATQISYLVSLSRPTIDSETHHNVNLK